MDQDQRKHTRFEPPFTDVVVKTQEMEITGRVLDSSRSGMAIKFPKSDAAALFKGTTVELTILSGNANADITGGAVVTRIWPQKNILFRQDQNGLIDNGYGVALQLNEELQASLAEPYLLSGNQQNNRLTAQAELAAIDIAHLSNYRRDLSECQMKLFMLSLTATVSLGSIYFGLIYHGAATKQLANPELSFWRMMIAALPGGLATACALMVAYKSISIQRVDSFILILKKCTVLKQYPREYKGWESAHRKFRHVLNSHKCKYCDVIRKCGEFNEQDKALLNSRSFFQSPRVGLFHILIFMSFISVMILSLTAVVFELLRYQLGIPSYMAMASFLTFIIMTAVFFLFYSFFHLRKGKYSVDYYMRSWVDIINNCRTQV